MSERYIELISDFADITAETLTLLTLTAEYQVIQKQFKGMDTDPELCDSWWERIKYYAQLAIERLEYGVNAVKELLCTLTIDERCGVMLEFEDANPDKFAQLLVDAPQLDGWFEVNRQPITIGYFDCPEEAYPLVLLAIREGKKPG